ncbi:MAG: nitroreductase family protein [Myxococcales bacterium]|nr:nitroreductase family protein [Myxococcales bacterium]
MSTVVQSLLALQHRDGWLSPDELRKLSRERGLPLHRLESVASFYTHFRRRPPPKHCVAVCRDLSCALAGPNAREALGEALRDRPGLEVVEVSCLGRCERAPAAALDDRPLAATAADVARALEGEEEAFFSLEAPRAWDAEIYASPDERFGTLRRALTQPPDALASELTRAGLRGMGGAGFPTGRKWALVAAEPEPTKFVICNADESEPGTFKDRQILADLPHLVLEGMLLGGYAIGAERGTLFIRNEYALERVRVEAAIEQARRLGALGANIFGSGWSFEIDVFVSPGGYILGEESALLECMEDRRGEPRNKPPFPGTSGLFEKPTLINNVETFAHATAIIARGAAWWDALAGGSFSGHKWISVSGDVAQPGVVLVPVGTSLGELLERCGGMRPGTSLGAIAPGGASSNFLTPEALDTPLDFETLQEAGSMLGSGAVIYLGSHHPLLAAGANVARFFRNESCGKCVPCRVGTEKALEILGDASHLSPDDEGLLRELHETLRRTSICGLGQVALAPLLSILDRFPEAKNST